MALLMVRALPIKDFASIKDVGTKDTFDFDWSNAKEQNYNITKRYGSLCCERG